MDFQIILTILIPILALVVSIVAVWYSHKSSKIAEASLYYVKSPMLIIEKKSPYYYVKNIGKGIAKNITWETGEHHLIKTNSEFFDFLLPESQSLSQSQMTPDGIEIPLTINKEGIKVGKKYSLILKYEDIENNPYISEFETMLDSEGTLRHKLKIHKRIER